jgi:hypothetical protein
MVGNFEACSAHASAEVFQERMRRGKRRR